MSNLENKETGASSTATCSCGHDHSHDDHNHDHHEHNHGGNEMTANVGCSCGHDHSHDDHNHGGNEMTANIGCSCGHDHSHDDHNHDHHEHNHSGNEMTANVGCSCGHDHSHEGHNHSEMTDGVGCGCGQDHSAPTEKSGGHTHDHGPFGTKEKIIFGASVVLAVLAMTLTLNPIVKLIIFAIAVIGVGYPQLAEGLRGIRYFDLHETALMTVAVIAAFAIGEYSEAFLVTALFRIGNILENMAVDRSKREIESLTNIRPDTANLQLEDGTIKQVAARSVQIGTTIVIRPGERVPLDSVIISGSSNLDTAALTGESLARQVEEGDSVLSGSVNLDGLLICKTTSTFENSTASRIIELVKESSLKKGQTENFITRFSKIYTPFIIVSAAALAFLPPLLGMGELSDWVGRSLVFLVASCPCALVISVPLSFFSGIGAASKTGVLVKGSKYLESLAKLDAVAFDKTGTLTTGNLTVSEVISTGDLSEDEIAALAATAEKFSTHPMANAITAYHAEIPGAVIEDYVETRGKGVSLKIDGKQVLCGSYKLMRDNNIDVSALPPANIYLTIDSKVVGCINLFDNPRPEAAAAINALKAAGVTKTILLSGDSQEAVNSVKASVGLDEAYGELLPEDKVKKFEELKNKSGITAFVGDGINDAPVLAQSDVGIAMGFGSDAAIEAADVVLVTENLSLLAKAIGIAKRTVSVANFNIWFALGIKAIVLVLGALNRAQMWHAVFADVGVSIIAVLNSSRILRTKK